MDRLRWIAVGIAVVIVVAVAVPLYQIVMPGAVPPSPASQQMADAYNGIVRPGALLRVPVTGIYPGGNAAGLNPNIANPLANDPDAVTRGMRDFGSFNCSACHGANGAGGMGPSLSDDAWLYRSSPANIYLSIVQGRGAGMPAFGAMLPDRTVWELVAYIQNIAEKPGPHFGRTTSNQPQMPDTEQVPQNRAVTPTPWKTTEPLPPNGEEPGAGP
jgi:cytochrome c oxidase cbb3-type subunit 3